MLGRGREYSIQMSSISDVWEQGQENRLFHHV